MKMGRKPTHDQKIQMDTMMKGTNFNLGEVCRRLRRGFIKGCHAYEAGLNTSTKHIKDMKEKQGFLMGWNGRQADEIAGLQPAEIGICDGCFVPDDIWQQR